ncbi:P-II family nitrogen regulator [Rhodocaloribacter sp.]|jgi:nitrogen regulatory protein P-II 1
MKEVKAYLRCPKVETVIEALEENGITGITVIDVMGLGQLADPHASKYSIKCVERYSDVAKLEVVCRDEDVHRIVELIRKNAYTGLPGDGIIFVSPVEMAVKIRTGAVNEVGL